MDRIYKWIAIILLLFSIGFNLWLYRAEPTTTIDPNDNAFQFALVERTNQIWEFANRTCPKTILFPICHFSYLIDHWVPNWAQGYNLPYYYSHVPQILIVGSYRLFSPHISLFHYYHIIIYVLLCFFPLSLFLAFRILQFPFLTAGIAALLASQISTDGLYGIDQSSFLWRGWGLSSQLFALIWLPLAIASIIQWAKGASRRSYVLSIVFLVLTTMGHLGIGMMAFLAIPILCINKNIKITIKQTLLLALPPLIILSYWIVPAFLNNNFHNISVWDPVWKFNSFGAKEVVTMLVNGNLFDFGRFPVFTILVLIGLFSSLLVILNLFQDDKKTIHIGQTVLFPYFSLGLLFLFYMGLFFGRTTWGGLLNFIPGMSEFHQHRFLVGVHLAGLFLAPIGITWMIEKISNFKFMILVGLVGLVGFTIYPQTLRYAQYNSVLINQANDEYAKAKPDFEELRLALRSLGEGRGRVYALRATEGKAFQIASTPYYMQLSTYGIPTVLWLPQTWSMNSDTEQFFSEDNPSHYELYNIKYIVAPPSKSPQPFWTLIKEASAWKLYTVETPGYITVGTAPSVVFSDKTSLINLVHLWIQSDYPKQQIYPQLTFSPLPAEALPALASVNRQAGFAKAGFPHFSMLDPVTYQTPDSIQHNLFAEVPVYLSNLSNLSDLVKITSQSTDTDMLFSARVEITAPCPACVVVLKQTYHPNWKVLVNGKKTTPIIVFPFFTAVRLEQPGMYDVVFSYTPKFRSY